MNEKILRLPEVQSCTGLSRSSIYAAMANNTFPKQVRLSARSVGWASSHVQSWLDSKIHFKSDNINVSASNDGLI